ncbi:MAG: cytochrome c biogenesis protein CcsA [Chitinophagales bacterium]
MNNFPAKLKKILSPLFNTRAAGLYMLLFAAAIGIATFVENDFGTSSAQKVIFKSRWFELLLVLFGISIVVNIFRFRMIQQKKWTILMFHLSMIVILLGAGVTRYFGFEGIMHIRENDASNTFLSADTYLKFEVLQKGNKYEFDEPVLFATLGNNNWKESYLIGSDLIEAEVKDFLPNPKQVLKENTEGKPTLKIVIAGLSGREEYFVRQGEVKKIRNVLYNFNEPPITDAINLAYRNDSLLIQADRVLQQTVMATQKKDTIYPSGNYNILMLRSLYSDGVNNFVFGDFHPQATVELISESPKVKGESMTALLMEVKVNGKPDEIYVYGKKGLPGNPTVTSINGVSMAVSYGAKEVKLPFAIKLYDFILEKYPGTESAASYASEVQLIDDRTNLKENHRIYMNHILDHDGYRFFQSSFDKDEQGTYLSVNHDFWGTWISYLGYFLLTLGMVMSFFSKKTRLYQVRQKLQKMHPQNAAAAMVLLSLLFVSNGLSAQKNIDPAAIQQTVAAAHAQQFSKLVVQDHKGRMKPVHTLSREVMRKLTGKESLYGLSADQIVLGMLSNNKDWYKVPMIKLGKHEKIQEQLGVMGKTAAYSDFFEETGGYKFKDEIRRAYNLQPIDRGVYEKELMKLDERVNIAGMVFSGRLLKIIPVPNDPNNTWVSAMVDHGQQTMDSPVAKKFFAAYIPGLQEAAANNDYGFVNQLITELDSYQKSKGAEVMPSALQIKSEILLNQMNPFDRLAVYDLLLGLAFLFFLFLSVFKPEIDMDKVYKVLFGLVVVGFAFHTLGLAIRWYVSERAPWSNGYESMIYIAWTSTLAGLIFARKSFGALAATMILASVILLVAMLSYLDPEITPLVPVLKSYWLTIHVSLEAGSYGFLMLGAIIGLINLILMIFLTETNKKNILRIVREMSYISEMTLIGGLFMVSIGTYLGGVWANESWGRYWGWDAKETWALVVILVYAFILHMRIIPKMTGLYAYNLATIFGWASVIMTYYGVNYYLSGLHSYAAGDPVPIPQWVYWVVVGVMIVSGLAFWRKRKVGGIG